MLLGFIIILLSLSLTLYNVICSENHELFLTTNPGSSDNWVFRNRLLSQEYYYYGNTLAASLGKNSIYVLYRND